MAGVNEKLDAELIARADMKDLKDLAKLGDALRQKDSIPNQLTAEEFSEFIPLYLHDTSPFFDGMGEDNKRMFCVDLSQKFQQRVDVFKPIEIHIEGSEPLVLPTNFATPQAIGREDIDAVNQFNTANFDDIPKYSTEALDKLLAAFLKAQGTDENVAYLKDMRATFIGQFERANEMVRAIHDGTLQDKPDMGIDDIESNDDTSDEYNDGSFGISWEQA